jgi:signal transduction histidine kinase
VDLGKKLDWLTWIYVLSLAVGLGVTGWCITQYFEPVFLEFHAEVARGQQVEHALELLRQTQELLRSPSHLEVARSEYQQLDQALSSELCELPSSSLPDPFWESLRDAARSVHSIAAQRLQARQPSTASANQSPPGDPGTFDTLKKLLYEVGAVSAQRRQARFEQASTIQQRALQLLILNAACGMLLCFLGLISVRSWVIEPVRELRRATSQFSLGNASFRARPRRRDELGRLAEEMNRMSDAINAMQAEMISRERLAAAGTLMQYVTHNIRTPLLGIRWLAEVLPVQETDIEAVHCRHEIMDHVDRLDQWLKGFQDSLAPGHRNPARSPETELRRGPREPAQGKGAA